MMEKSKLRQADFVSAVLLFLFGVWVVYQAAQMPMRESFGGVRNVWYVSPALLPLIVGSGIAVLGLLLLSHAIRSGGAAGFFRSLRGVSREISDANQRFLGVLLAIMSLVYLLIPRVDFVLSILLFLLYSVPAFYYDSPVALRRLSAAYGAVITVLFLLFATGAADLLNGLFPFSTDVVALAGAFFLIAYNRLVLVTNPVLVGKFRVSLMVAIITPLVLTPVFRFLLFVRLPHEGGIVQLMQLIWFSLR